MKMDYGKIQVKVDTKHLTDFLKALKKSAKEIEEAVDKSLAEFLKEPTLWERIKERFLARIIYHGNEAYEPKNSEHWRDYNEKQKILIRDIVDYAWHKGCTSKANDHYDGKSTREYCYKELKVEK